MKCVCVCLEFSFPFNRPTKSSPRNLPHQIGSRGYNSSPLNNNEKRLVGRKKHPGESSNKTETKMGSDFFCFISTLWFWGFWGSQTLLQFRNTHHPRPKSLQYHRVDTMRKYIISLDALDSILPGVNLGVIFFSFQNTNFTGSFLPPWNAWKPPTLLIVEVKPEIHFTKIQWVELWKSNWKLENEILGLGLFSGAYWLLVARSVICFYSWNIPMG